MGPATHDGGYVNNTFCFDAGDMGQHQVNRCHDGEYNVTVDENSTESGVASMAFGKKIKPLELALAAALLLDGKDARRPRPTQTCNPKARSDERLKINAD